MNVVSESLVSSFTIDIDKIIREGNLRNSLSALISDGGDSVECAGQLLLHPSRHGTLIKPSGEKNDRKSRPGRWLSALSSRGSHLEVSYGL